MIRYIKCNPSIESRLSIGHLLTRFHASVKNVVPQSVSFMKWEYTMPLDSTSRGTLSRVRTACGLIYKMAKPLLYF